VGICFLVQYNLFWDDTQSFFRIAWQLFRTGAAIRGMQFFEKNQKFFLTDLTKVIMMVLRF
jgi:hypothetical protein